MNGGSREMSPVGHKVAERSLSTVTLASERLGMFEWGARKPCRPVP